MDLNAPLGLDPPRTPRSAAKGRTLGLIAGSAIALVLATGLGVFLATADPHGGDPYVVAAIPPPGRAAPAAAPPAGRSPAIPSGQTLLDPSRTGSIQAIRPLPNASPETASVENGVRVFRTAPAGDAAATHGGPLVIDVSKVLDDPLGRTKATAANAHPGPTIQPASGTTRPRIAIFVSGMGLSQAATKAAMDAMPAAVTLAFVPYGMMIGATVAAAKAKGHEILLQIPMQNGAGAAPGPHALHPDESATALRDDLAWLMSRFDGYDGVTNLLGAPVTADEAVMTALLRDVRARGFYYVDDGLSKRETGLSVGARLDVPTLQADLVLDATADARVVEANLQTLAAIARRKGSAIGMASGLPDHMAAIARFAGSLEAQGITLVPLAELGTAKAATTRGVAVNR